MLGGHSPARGGSDAVYGQQGIMEAKPAETSALANGALPAEHEDQMQLGVRIITTAFTSKMHQLQQEIHATRLTSEEQRVNVAQLQKKNSQLEGELVDIRQRSQQFLEENKGLSRTVQSLKKQVGRLEHLKQAVLSSIQDDQVQEAEIGDTRALMSDEFLRGATPLTNAAHAAELGYPTNSASRPMALPPHQPSAPASQPVSAVPSQQAYHPSFQHEASFDGGVPAQAGYDAQAQQLGGSPVIDGKQFFRQARSRLSYESFNLFLASIKRLNNQQQSREDTLEEARRIFGPELGDLYKDFENLLNRHGML